MQNMRVAFRNDSRTTGPQSLAPSYGRSIEQGKSFEGPEGGQVGGSHGSGSSGAAGSGSGGHGGGSGSGGSGPGGGSGK